MVFVVLQGWDMVFRGIARLGYGISWYCQAGIWYIVVLPGWYMVLRGICFMVPPSIGAVEVILSD